MALSSSAPGVLVYNGKSYAVGLLWFTIQEENGKHLLQQRIKKTHADFYCERTHISQQQGFGWLNRGHKRGMPVAAAMVADQLVGEWHGVFEAENGWWYVQVRSDTITPNGDQFFATEEEAYNLFQSEMQKHTWPHAYAPEKWRISDVNTRELSLKTLLDELATTKLTGANFTAAFGGKAQRNLVFLLLALIVAVMIGLVLYTLAKSDDEVFAKNPKPNFVPHTIQAKKTVLDAPAKIGEFISPQQMLEQCGKAADTLMTSLPGWRMDNFTCGNGHASLNWQQGNGTLSGAKEQGLKTWSATTSVTFKNHTMTVTQTLDKLPFLQPEHLLTQEQALLALEQDFQPLGALSIKPVTPAVPRPPVQNRSTFSTDTPPPPPPPAPLPYLDVQFISGFSPEKLLPSLGAPGLEVTDVSWAVAKGIWQYKLKWTYERIAAPASGKKAPAAGGTP